VEDVSQPIVPDELDPLGLAVSPTGAVERKLATVLFVDLVGSTALFAASDPEVARRRVTQFFELASGIIDAHAALSNGSPATL
jgi:class 3 adenylate cyclase